MISVDIREASDEREASAEVKISTIAVHLGAVASAGTAGDATASVRRALLAAAASLDIHVEFDGESKGG